MFLMPHFFHDSIGQKNKNISNSLLNNLGLMNAFFWTSFIIYDDFWDEDEAARPELLPLANTMSRCFFSFFENIFKEDKFYYNFFRESLNKLDEANFFEVTECRKMKTMGFGDMNIKFYPSVGHVFGPLAILLQLGYKFKDQETQKTISFFKNYLIARQLSDDMHDVEEDWRRGHLSLAINELLINAKEKNIEEFSKRNYLFWTKTIDNLCAKSFKLINAARYNLEQNKAISKPKILNKLLDDLENSAKRALKERDERLQFAKDLASS